jgi:ribosomal protein S18 acetylase RimI-like enzyme
MDNPPSTPGKATALEFRSAAVADWAQVEPLVAQTWADGDYITESVWHDWVQDEGYTEVALSDGRIVGLGRLVELSPAEWWLEGIRIHPELRHQGIGRAMIEHLLAIFRQKGIGLLRFVTEAKNEAMVALAGKYNFRHTNSFEWMQASAQVGDYRNFKVLGPNNLNMVHGYLRNSPMNRVNRFAEHDWVYYYLTQERLAQFLADPSVQVLGWRELDKLHGLAIVFNDPPGGDDGDGLKIGCVDAPDDTTLKAMLTGLRGLALKENRSKAAWKAPQGVGLDQTVSAAGFETQNVTLWLFELPLRL